MKTWLELHKEYGCTHPLNCKFCAWCGMDIRDNTYVTNLANIHYIPLDGDFRPDGKRFSADYGGWTSGQWEDYPQKQVSFKSIIGRMFLIAGLVAGLGWVFSRYL